MTVIWTLPSLIYNKWDIFGVFSSPFLSHQIIITVELVNVTNRMINEAQTIIITTGIERNSIDMWIIFN